MAVRRFTVVWVDIEGEEFVNGPSGYAPEGEEHRRDPRVALSLLGYHTTQGMREYVVIYGTARVTEGGAVPLLQRLAPIYLGPGAEYPPASMRNITGLWHQNHAGTLHWDWSVDSTSHWLTMSHH
jgi:hypothetical protein